MRFLVCQKQRTNGISYHRLIKPFEFLQRDYGFKVTFFDNFQSLGSFSFSDYDYLVFNRSMGYSMNEEVQIINQFKEAGVKIILDIDDYWHLPEHHTIRWREDLDYHVWQSNILANIRLADYLITSTEVLYDHLCKIKNPQTKIVLAKNAIDYYEEQWVKEEVWKNESRVRIGYAGSTTHHMDLEPLRPVCQRINANKNLRRSIKWHLFGVDFSKDWTSKVWNNNIDIFTCGRKYTNVYMSSGVNVFRYAHFYDNMDISIASVLDNEFNQSKSELKILEAGAKYKPFIGSNTLTYNRTEANVDLCSTTEEWVESIVDLVRSKSLREELGKELGEYVRDTYRIERENEKRLSIL